MPELGFLGGERLREPQDLDNEVVYAYAAVGHRRCTGALRETRYRHATGTHGLERDQNRVAFTACWSCETSMASAEASGR